MSESQLVAQIAKAMYGPGWEDAPVEDQEVVFQAAMDALPVVREQKAEGWDQGYADCWTYHQSEGLVGTQNNPFKEIK